MPELHFQTIFGPSSTSFGNFWYISRHFWTGFIHCRPIYGPSSTSFGNFRCIFGTFSAIVSPFSAISVICWAIFDNFRPISAHYRNKKSRCKLFRVRLTSNWFWVPVFDAEGSQKCLAFFFCAKSRFQWVIFHFLFFFDLSCRK